MMVVRELKNIVSSAIICNLTYIVPDLTFVFLDPRNEEVAMKGMWPWELISVLEQDH